MRIGFPQFGFRNTSLRNLVLGNCHLNPSGCVNWSSLVSLSIGNVAFMEDVMEKVLLGCPNLECLELDKVCGIRCLEINSVKMRKLIITNHETKDGDEYIHWPEIIAPDIRHLEVLGLCYYDMRLQLRNVDSLVTIVLCLDVDFYELKDENDKLEKECRYLQELLHCVANVENLELGPWCIQCLSIREMKGLLLPRSSWKCLKLTVEFAAFYQVHQIWRHWSLIGTMNQEACCQGTQMRMNKAGGLRHIILAAHCYV